MTRPEPYYIEEYVELGQVRARVSVGTQSLDVFIMLANEDSKTSGCGYIYRIGELAKLRQFLDALHEAGRLAGREEMRLS